MFISELGYSRVKSTVISFVSIIAKFGICTVVGLNGILVESKIRTWDTGMCMFSLQPVSQNDGPNAEFSTN